MPGGLSSGITHEERSNSMNSSAFSCGVSVGRQAAVRERLLARIRRRARRHVQVAHHDAAALLLGRDLDRRVEREVLDHRRVLGRVAARRSSAARRGWSNRRCARRRGSRSVPASSIRRRSPSSPRTPSPFGKLVSIGRRDVRVEAVRARAVLRHRRPRRRAVERPRRCASASRTRARPRRRSPSPPAAWSSAPRPHRCCRSPRTTSA